MPSTPASFPPSVSNSAASSKVSSEAADMQSRTNADDFFFVFISIRQQISVIFDNTSYPLINDACVYVHNSFLHFLSKLLFIRMLFISHSGHRLVVPHEELGIFLKDLVRNFAGHGDDRGVVTLLPGLLEPGADSLDAEYLESFLL